MYLPQFGITNTLPRAGAREQGRAAIGRRMAALPNSHVCRKSPCQPGVLLGAATPPSDPQMEGFDVAAWQLGGLVLHQTAGAAGWRSKAAVVHQGGGAASGGIGAAAAAEVVVGLAVAAGQAWNSPPAISSCGQSWLDSCETARDPPPRPPSPAQQTSSTPSCLSSHIITFSISTVSCHT